MSQPNVHCIYKRQIVFCAVNCINEKGNYFIVALLPHPLKAWISFWPWNALTCFWLLACSACNISWTLKTCTNQALWNSFAAEAVLNVWPFKRFWCLFSRFTNQLLWNREHFLFWTCYFIGPTANECLWFANDRGAYARKFSFLQLKKASIWVKPSQISILHAGNMRKLCTWWKQGWCTSESTTPAIYGLIFLFPLLSSQRFFFSAYSVISFSHWNPTVLICSPHS